MRAATKGLSKDDASTCTAYADELLSPIQELLGSRFVDRLKRCKTPLLTKWTDLLDKEAASLRKMLVSVAGADCSQLSTIQEQYESAEVDLNKERVAMYEWEEKLFSTEDDYPLYGALHEYLDDLDGRQ